MRSHRATSAFTYPLLASIAVVCLAGGVAVATAHVARDLRGEVTLPTALALAETSTATPIDEPAPPEPAPPELPTTDVESAALPPAAPDPPITESPSDSGAGVEPSPSPPPDESQPSDPAEDAQAGAGDQTAGARFTPRPSPTPPPTRVIPADSLPANLAEARSILRERRKTARPASAAAGDLGFVLGLSERFIDKPAPEGRARAIELTTLVNAWWFDRWAAPGRAVVVRDPSGLVYTYRAGRGFALNPVATTGRWQRINADVPAPALADALLEVSVAHTAGTRDFLLWEYYDVPDRPGAIRPGASGMAQGRMASLLAESYRLTADDRYAEAALGALSAFTVPVDRGGVLSRPADPATGVTGPWYVERAYPDEDAWKGAALNGFMVTILNLRGARKRLSVPEEDQADQAEQVAPAVRAQTEHAARIAEELADQGAETLRTFLPLHDTGEWSQYGLLTPGYAFGEYLADVNYHCYHVSLLERLDRIYPNHGFGVTAQRWSGYVDDVRLDCATARKGGAQS